MSAYDSLSDIVHIEELQGWQLTTGLEIEVEDSCYHIWKPTTDQHIRLIRGTGPCAWGWGALLNRTRPSIIGSMISMLYPLVGMMFGLKDRFSEEFSN